MFLLCVAECGGIHTYNPSIWETEVKLQVKGQMSYLMRSCQIKSV